MLGGLEMGAYGGDFVVEKGEDGGGGSLLVEEGERGGGREKPTFNGRFRLTTSLTLNNSSNPTYSAPPAISSFNFRRL